ncbi:hypothetical protein FA95DRAFT_1611827 [Auriscalpium vulgare]|uniref:Uncharacterized protein n=1 Tax=Auriscalpium vulgare TaxID=40419 RepID=A0ACB8R8G3_9AGAM|nr:hypothetical protein FA95DRAFT_1611827 [Auriscalpium vulgare]
MSGQTASGDDRPQPHDVIDIFLVKASKVRLSYTSAPSTDPTNVDIVFEAADQHRAAGTRSSSAHRQPNAQTSPAANTNPTVPPPMARNGANAAITQSSQSMSDASDSQAGSVLCPETPTRLRGTSQAQRDSVHYAASLRSPREFFTGAQSVSPADRAAAEAMFSASGPFERLQFTRLPGGTGTMLTARTDEGPGPRTGDEDRQRIGAADTRAGSGGVGPASPASSHTEPSTPMYINPTLTSPPPRSSRRTRREARGSSPWMVQADVDDDSQVMARDMAENADGVKFEDEQDQHEGEAHEGEARKRGRDDEEDGRHESKRQALANASGSATPHPDVQAASPPDIPTQLLFSPTRRAALGLPPPPTYCLNTQLLEMMRDVEEGHREVDAHLRAD